MKKMSEMYDSLFKVTCLDGPVLMDEVDATVDGFADGPFYAWFDVGTTAEEMQQMLRGVLLFIERHGIDLIFGFSQA